MNEKTELKRDLGLFEVTISGIGIILGAGIYALIGEAASLAGNALWISFALSSLVALFTGLSYAELSSMFPRASAEYEYTLQAFGRKVAFMVGWLIIFSGAVGAATVALGFAGYYTALFGTHMVTTAIVLIAVLSIVLFIGIKQSAWVAIIFTLIETLGLLIVIALGLPHLGEVNYLEMPLGFDGVFQAAALIFFAFIGFEEMVKLSEETREPEKNIPRGLVLAVTSSIILYILVAISAVSIMGWQELGQSSAPFADIARTAFGQSAFVVLSVIALFSTTNTVLLMLLAASRITYGMAEEGSLPRFLAAVHPRTRTPWAAIAVMALLSVAFLFAGSISFVADVTNFTLFVTFLTINAALVLLRRKMPERARPFRVPGSLGWLPLLPIIGLIFNILMISQLSMIVLLTGLALVITGGILSLRQR